MGKYMVGAVVSKVRFGSSRTVDMKLTIHGESRVSDKFKPDTGPKTAVKVAPKECLEGYLC